MSSGSNTKKSLGLNRVSVATKMTLLLLLTALIPMITLFAVFMHSTPALEKTSIDNYQGIAESVGNTIDRNLFERYGDVQAFGYNAVAYDPNNWKIPGESSLLVKAMNNYVKAYGMYPLMLLVDKTGAVLAANSVDLKGNPINSAGVYNINYADKQWFKDAMAGRFLEGRNGLTGTVVMEPERNSDIAKIYSNDGFTVAFAAPVKDFKGEVIGVWVNFADFTVVEDIIGVYKRDLISKGMSDADLMLFDNKGRVLVDYDPSTTDENGNLKRDFEVIQKSDWVAQGVEALKLATTGTVRGVTTEATPDTDGKLAVVAYYNMQGAYDYKGLGWTMTVTGSEEQVKATILMTKNTMMYAGVALCVATLILGLFIGKASVRPIKTLVTTMDKLANKDYALGVPFLSRGDELGGMARAVEVFKENGLAVQKLEAAQEAQKIQAERDKKEAMHQLANDFDMRTSNVIKSLAAAATEMQATAAQMTAAAGNTTHASQIVASAATEADSNVQTVAAATEELTSSSNEIARQIASVAEKSARASSEAEATSVQVGELNTLADSIGEVVSAIKAIAEQTNLLALNATIEAARAGDAGKGFAVVADEVKKLANDTAQKTIQIDERVVRIQTAVRATVDAVGRIIRDVREIDHATGTVASAVEEQNAATSEIGRNITEASSGTQQVASNIIEVQRNAEETTESATNLNGAATELSQIANTLQKEVTNFLGEIRGS